MPLSKPTPDKEEELHWYISATKHFFSYSEIIVETGMAVWKDFNRHPNEFLLQIYCYLVTSDWQWTYQLAMMISEICFTLNISTVRLNLSVFNNLSTECRISCHMWTRGLFWTLRSSISGSVMFLTQSVDWHFLKHRSYFCLADPTSFTQIFKHPNPVKT